MCSSPRSRGGETNAPVTAAVVDRIKAQMAGAGLTQVALSSKTGIERSTLVRRLQGRSPFRVDELEAIAQVLECTVASLVEEAAA